jgi:LPXTG-site transpeptidase (sortase) family protein
MTAHSGIISGKYFFSRLALILVILAGLLGSTSRPVSAGVCPSPVIVINNNRDGAGSLRQAIADVCANGTILFDRSLSGATITLDFGALNVFKNMTIDGSDLDDPITLKGNITNGVMYNTAVLVLKSLKITDGINGSGGGIYNDGTLTIINSTISNNKAEDSSGGGIQNNGTLTIINCTFSGNFTSGDFAYGGAIYNDGTMTVLNSTFYGNYTKSTGSAIYNNKQMKIVNSTVYGNTGNVAIYNTHSMELINTILAGTVGFADCYTMYSGTITAASKNNLIQTNSTGHYACNPSSSIFGSDPKLDALADNGGHTQTHALQIGSPAIDAGDYATCTGADINSMDQRAVSRKDASGKCDIGAFEVGTHLTPEVKTSSPVMGASLSTSLSRLTVIFNKDVDSDTATSTANYLLVRPGEDHTFQTSDCLSGKQGDDVQVPVNSVSYDKNTFTSTVNINGGATLPNDEYQLRVCGTTSIMDTAAIKLNNGTDDTRVDFTVNAAGAGTGGTTRRGSGATSTLPATGFAPGKVTALPKQTAAYNGLNIRLEIPAIGVNAPVVGVADGSDVTWLGHDAGWLNNTAFPTWAGNSVITGHVWDADNLPGLFANLKTLKYGDTVLVHAFKSVYTYEVRDSQLVSPTSTRSVFRHEDQPWISLLTCEDFNTDTLKYTGRRLVRAVLVDVKPE